VKKACAIVANEPDLMDLDDDMRRIDKQARAKLRLLETETLRLLKETEAAISPLWSEMAEWLRERDLLPEGYSKDTYTLSIEDGVLYVSSKSAGELLLDSVKNSLFKDVKDGK